MRKVNVKLKNRNGEDIIYEEISKVKLNTSKGEAVFSLGIPKELSVTPEFLSGNIEVLAPDDTLYEKVTINKPENLVPENIAKDVVVAGITGTFEGKPELPTLNKPSISRNQETISITNPSSNGNFNKKFIIYSNDEIAFDQTNYYVTRDVNYYKDGTANKTQLSYWSKVSSKATQNWKSIRAIGWDSNNPFFCLPTVLGSSGEKTYFKTNFYGPYNSSTFAYRGRNYKSYNTNNSLMTLMCDIGFNSNYSSTGTRLIKY